MFMYMRNEHLVIAVFIVAGFSILFFVGSYVAVTGKAISVAQQQERVELVIDGVANRLSRQEVISGEGRMRCDILCLRQANKPCLFSLTAVDGKCKTVVNNGYKCVCA